MSFEQYDPAVEFRLSTFNKVKSHWTNIMLEVDSADYESIITSIEGIDYTDENNSYEVDCPEKYRDELVAWLREEYL